ncbi:MAG: TIGR04211 family SH3 domain-containing protein, partial [Gammaproteobacteria bacterium]
MRKFLAPAVVSVMMVAVSLIITEQAHAQSLYVTDKISIGIYRDSSVESERIKSLPSGAIVNVLTTENGFTRIRTTDNIEGWVQSKFLSNEKPTQIAYVQLASKYQALQQKLQNQQQQLTGMQELRKEAQTADWLRNRMSGYRLNEQTLQNELRVKDIAIAELKITVANLEDQLNTALEKLEHTSNSIAASTMNQSAYQSIGEPAFYQPRSSAGFYTW